MADHGRFPNIEVISFVSPRWVTPMGDAADVMTRIQRKPGVIYSVLPSPHNMKGLHGTLVAKADEVVIFDAAREAFS